MTHLYLKRSIGAWSAGTRVEEIREVNADRVMVRAMTGDPKLDESLRRQREIEVFKNDLVSR